MPSPRHLFNFHRLLYVRSMSQNVFDMIRAFIVGSQLPIHNRMILNDPRMGFIVDFINANLYPSSLSSCL